MTTTPTGSGPEDQAAISAISRLFDDSRRRLVGTGTRDRLVHVNRANTRGNVLNIVNERSDGVHAILGSLHLAFYFGNVGVQRLLEQALLLGAQAGTELLADGGEL